MENALIQGSGNGVSILISVAMGTIISNVSIQGQILSKGIAIGGLIGATYPGNPNHISYCNLSIIIKGNGIDQSQIGGLIGYGENAIIHDIIISGNITTNSQDGGGMGGVIGAQEGGTISNTWSSVSISGPYDIGGIVGQCRGQIHTSYSQGNVRASEKAAGGITGRATNCSISNSYATGTIYGVYMVGGLVGWLPVESVITNSYAVGLVKSIVGGAGGLIGEITVTPNVTSSYWDTETTNQTHSGGDAGNGKLTSQMKMQSTYQDWDFMNIWAIEEGKTYPYLRVFRP